MKTCAIKIKSQLQGTVCPEIGGVPFNENLCKIKIKSQLQDIVFPEIGVQKP